MMRFGGQMAWDIFSQLKSHILFRAMEFTVEGSPWHREANVLVHTEMVLMEYIKSTDDDVGVEGWSYADMLGAMCCIWHDVGKPAAKIEKESPERGKYFAFHGHELVSARMFENFYVSEDRKSVEWLAREDIFTVAWMIQNHMPWATSDKAKLRQLKATAMTFGVLKPYVRALMADAKGRYADDYEKKVVQSFLWTTDLLMVNAADLFDTARTHPEPDVPRVIIPIAPSGAGKSTLYDKYVSTLDTAPYHKFSLDALRHEWYHDTDYAEAYRLSTEDSKFGQKANNVYLELVRAGKNVYVDNTNLSTKRRSFYIQEARRRGYRVTGVVILSSLTEIAARQQTRGDKNVPLQAVKQQYMSLQLPNIGEMDAILVI